MLILAKIITFLDETLFYLDRYVNKQYYRVCDLEKPQVVWQKQMYPLWVTVCCSLWGQSNIGLCFFETEKCAIITANGDTYHTMINDFLYPLFRVLMWAMFDLKILQPFTHHMPQLGQTFDGRIFRRSGDINKLRFNYFLWSTVK